MYGCEVEDVEINGVDLLKISKKETQYVRSNT